jgi:hypothetical protein
MKYLNFLLLASNAKGSRNRFKGRIPLRLGDLRDLKRIRLDEPTLSGPLPEFFRSTGLDVCGFSKAFCREWEIPSYFTASSDCDFETVPLCSPDCMVLYDWLGDAISPSSCCLDDRFTCDDNQRISGMFVSLA